MHAWHSMWSEGSTLFEHCGRRHWLHHRTLVENTHGVGSERRNELAGIHSARRGSYRVLYRIDERARSVTVLRIDHRGDVYRTP